MYSIYNIYIVYIETTKKNSLSSKQGKKKVFSREHPQHAPPGDGRHQDPRRRKAKQSKSSMIIFYLFLFLF
jgi:hypothetical protein